MSHFSAEFSKTFKEADIRGVYPREIDEEVVYCIARAFVEEYAHTKVLVARDMRLSSPQLHDAFIKGVTDAGATVVDLGLTTTPMLYFASATMKLPGVMITASHSPKDQNGLKLVQAGAVPLTAATGLNAIRRRLTRGQYATAPTKGGRVLTKDITAGYTRFVTAGIKKATVTPRRKVVVDTGNGMGALLIPLLEKHFNLEVTVLFPELDGRFPNRGSNPTVPKNQTSIIEALKRGGYDFGIAFDGDADRVAFFDEQGRYINCAAIGALIATELLRTHPKATCVYTVLTSRAYTEAVRSCGGRLVAARVGHSYIKQVMHKHDALFACEHSGHFFFKDFFYTDSVILALRYVLLCYNQAGVAFSALLAPHTRYVQTEDLMVPMGNPAAALADMERFATQCSPVSIKRRDGLVVDFGDVTVVVKPSVTESALNIVAEGMVAKRTLAVRNQFVAEARTLA